MSTGTTRTFNLQVDEIIRIAMRRAYGTDQASGVEASDARMLLNLILTDLVNRGAPLSTFKVYDQTVTLADADYTLSGNLVDLYDVSLVRDNLYYPMRRISLFDYHKISDKTIQGQPSMFAVDRQNDAPILYVYPSPENSTDSVNYYAITRNFDVTGSNQNVDMSYRFTPALVSGLAYYLALQRPEISEKSPMRNQELKAQYEQELQSAFEEDHERNALKIGFRLR